MNEERLNRLFRRYQKKGELAALAEVFDQSAPELIKVARRLCGDEAEAEDAVQATFQTAIEKSATWDAKRPLVPWLVGILTHHARKARERAERWIEEDRLHERSVDDPAALVAGQELGALIEEKLESLPDTYAGALRSYLFDGAPAREIAQRLGISPNAASVRLHRGLKLLQRALPAGASLGVAGMLAGTSEARGLAAVKSELFAGGAVRTGATVSAAAGAGGSSWWAAVASKQAVAVLGAAAVVSGAVVVGPRIFSTPDDDRRDLVAPVDTSDDPSAESAERTSVSAAATADLDKPKSARIEASAETRATPATEAEPVALDYEAWLARFEAAEGWREGLAIGNEIAQLPADQALELMRAIYHRIPSIDHRQQILKPFVFHGGHVHALEILDLAAADSSLEVQSWAFGYLKDYAYQDFSEDYSAYQAWRARFAGRPLGEVLSANVSELATRLEGLRGDDLARALEPIENLDLRPGKAADIDLAELLRNRGMLDIVGRWLIDEPEVAVVGLKWLSKLNAPENWLRASVLPLLQAERASDMRTFDAACTAIGQEGNTWAVEPLIEAYRGLPADERATAFGPMQALASVRDPQAIPTLIGMIISDPQTAYAVGHFALADLTGVRYDESHDGVFWSDWWTKNQDRLPPEIRGAAIPRIVFPH